MVKTRLSLVEVTPTWMVNGIFNYLQEYGVPWQALNFSLELDLEYYGNHSGNKIISPLVSKLLPTDNVLSSDELSVLAKIIYTMFGQNWDKLWETLQLE